MNRYEIKFVYSDALSNYEERNQSCILYADNESEARSKCIALYGLGTDCDYRIVSVKMLQE